jgi:hypothetical protein
MIDPSNGYVMEGSGSLSRTTNSGGSWVRLSISTEMLMCMSFVNPEIGYLGGRDRFYRTINGGASWTTIYTGTDILSMHFTSENTGYAVSAGTIYKHVYLPPAAPVLTAPDANAQNIALAVNLVWDVVPHTVNYRAQVATDSLFASIVFNDSTLLSATTYVENLSYGTTYYWRVNGKNSGGSGPWSAVRKFTTLPPPVPAVPVLVSPAAAATGLPVATNLVWNRSTHAATYRVQLAADSLFATLILNDSTLTDTARSTGTLANNTAYWWRVNARNISGTSAYSAPRRYTTAPVSLKSGDLRANISGGMRGDILQFNLPNRLPVRIRLYDSRGALAARLMDEEKTQGSHELSLPGEHAGGVYLLDFRAGEYRQILKLVR